MKLSHLKVSVLLVLSIAMLSCKSNKKDSSSKTEEAKEYLIFLDKEEAEKQIVKDATDGFFESITIADMSIQMKKADMPGSGGESKVLYQNHLKTEMESFTPSEKEFIHEVFASAKSAIDKINPKLMPDHIELIKTKTNHYGPDVYYTREDAIILPKNIFQNPSVGDQMPIMLHEIFHILSRYNEDFRNKMYALIGFSQFNEDLVLPREISDRLLTNPDGVRKDYAINLKDKNGNSQMALPLILSTKKGYQASMPTFFAYLSFDLYPLIKITPNQVTLGLNSDGGSALSVEHNGNFFEQIKDNTQYIIHPDEIMADNFMMAIIANQNNSFENFSEEGKQLLMDVIEILKTFE